LNRVRTLGYTVLGGAFALLVARTFFFGLYYVDSPSMEPGLHGAPKGGDYVIVRYGDGKDLKRFDTVVLVPKGETEPFVKRVAALPGESVVIRGGNLWIDDSILRSDALESNTVVVFDDQLSDLERAFRLGDVWSESVEGWRLDASSVDVGANAGLMYMRLGLKDHHYVRSSEFTRGVENVADGILEFQVEVVSPSFLLRFGMNEQGDSFEVSIEAGAGPSTQLTLSRMNSSRPETLAETNVYFPRGERSLRFSNVNDRLSVWIDGTMVVDELYDGNVLLASDLAKTGMSRPSDRVFLGGSAGVGLFSGIRVLRDIHYTPRGTYAKGAAVQLGPHQIFVLGDNSRDSEDGRDWGPIDLDSVLGRVIGIAWPPERMRTFPSGTGD
jgi:signal peptidase I